MERKRAQAQNEINGRVARRENPVYAGFKLELAGAERYPRADQLCHIGIYVLVPDADKTEVNTRNGVLISTNVGAQTHSDATRRIWRSISHWNLVDSFLSRQARPFLQGHQSFGWTKRQASHSL